MCRVAAVGAFFLLSVLRADPQPPDAHPEPVVLKSTSRAVQLDVFVTDPKGLPIQGLQKSDFVVADNGRPRDIRIFAPGMDPNQTAQSSGQSSEKTPPGVYSNRLGMRDAPLVTAIVIDAVPRPEELQRRVSTQPMFSHNFVFWRAINAIRWMEPGQVMAIYAANPDLRVVYDYTSVPDRLIAATNALFDPRPRDPDPKKFRPTATLVPQMLSALREVAGRMSGASGRKTVVWISPLFDAEFNPSAFRAATESTIAAFNDANVALYAVDSRFSPTCQPPLRPLDGDRVSEVVLECSQPPDISDDWMKYLAEATGGRAFSGGRITGIQGRDPVNQTSWGRYEVSSEHSAVTEALRFAGDDSRYAYQLGFYVPESELDGKFHRLSVSIPSHPKLDLRYRTGYTASAGSATGLPATPAPEPASELKPDEVGIDGKIDVASKNELRVSLALAPETVTRSADGTILVDASFIQTNDSGKQVAKIQETLRLPATESQTDMVPYARDLKLIKGAVLLHISIRDQATNRVGSLVIPIGK
jgi:VWFA-related protein